MRREREASTGLFHPGLLRPPMVNCAKIGPRKDQTRAEAVKRKAKLGNGS